MITLASALAVLILPMTAIAIDPRVTPSITMQLHSPDAELAFSPDGRTLVVLDNADTVRLFDPSTGRRIGTLGQQVTGMYKVPFSPDDRTNLTLGQDGGVRLWEAATGKPAALGDRVGAEYLRFLALASEFTSVGRQSKIVVSRVWR